MFWITEEKTGPGFGEKKYKEYCAIFAKNVAHAIDILISLEFPAQ